MDRSIWMMMMMISTAALVDNYLEGVAVSRECRQSSLGFGYTGSLSRTVSGRTCQAWSAQSPHRHGFTDDRFFPDDTIKGASNHCRNPAPGNLAGLWCFTTDRMKRWERCDVPACSEYPECRLTDIGSEYRGQVSVTSSGKNCLPWKDVNNNGSILAEELESNFCRNPDNRPGGPWCFVDASKWEYCRVPFCKPSASCKRTNLGAEYVGRIGVTRSGWPCQRWDSQIPHSHPYFTSAHFPDGSSADANHFCRNPDQKPGGLWCFTKNPDVEWEYCDVQICEDCKISSSGVEYAGNVSFARSGKRCFQWSRLSSHAANLLDPDRFPDASINDAGSFCRNPDRKPDGPWCFTNDSKDQWEYCEVKSCTGKESDTFKPRISNHVLHIGIDGLHPCFVNSSSGAPNIMERIGKSGIYTLTKGRTVLQTLSAPSWGATVCGMAVESTGITDNFWKAPWLGFEATIQPITGDSIPLPCIWQEIKNQDPNIRTATFTDWDWWWYITSMGIPGAIDFDFFCAPRLDGGYQQCDANSVGNATRYLKQVFQSSESSYTFVYLTNVDATGHSSGWCGPEYQKAVDVVDGLVGQLLDVIDKAGVADEVTVLLNTDHGGHGLIHGSWQDSDLVVPLFVRGPGFKKNEQFKNEVRNWDMAPTALEVLGIRQSPWWKGEVLTEAFV